MQDSSPLRVTKYQDRVRDFLNPNAQRSTSSGIRNANLYDRGSRVPAKVGNLNNFSASHGVNLYNRYNTYNAEPEKSDYSGYSSKPRLSENKSMLRINNEIESKLKAYSIVESKDINNELYLGTGKDLISTINIQPFRTQIGDMWNNSPQKSKDGIPEGREFGKSSGHKHQRSNSFSGKLSGERRPSQNEMKAEPKKNVRIEFGGQSRLGAPLNDPTMKKSSYSERPSSFFDKQRSQSYNAPEKMMNSAREWVSRSPMRDSLRYTKEQEDLERFYTLGTTALIENQRNSNTITIKTPIKNPGQSSQRDQKISISFQEEEGVILSIKNFDDGNREILISPHKNPKNEKSHTSGFSQSPVADSRVRRGTASTSRFEDVRADDQANS